MHQFEIILALLVAVVLLGIAARRLGVPSPVLLVVGGLVIALLPGLPPVEFEPRLIFVVFIPPLLYRAALTSSWRDLRANVRPITLLAVGLVVFTTVVVGVAAHALAPGLPWAAASWHPPPGCRPRGCGAWSASCWRGSHSSSWGSSCGRCSERWARIPCGSSRSRVSP